MSRTIRITESQLGHIIGNGLVEEIQKELKNQASLILETCGVGATPYIQEIENISQYAAQYVKENKKDGVDLRFEIPLKYTTSIKIFSILRIICTVTDNIKAKLGGNSKIKQDPLALKKDVKFYEAQTINIIAYADGNVLNQRTFIGTLYHELNHKIDELHHPEGKGTAYNQGKMLQQIKKLTITNEYVDWYLKKIIYRLFSNTEMNAVVASVYGDLASMKSQRQNYNVDIKKTEAYLEYAFLSINIYILNDIPDEGYDVLYKNLYGTALFPARKEKPIGLQKFKQRFILTVGQRLSDLLKRIGKTASYYYSMQEHLGQLPPPKGGGLLASIIKKKNHQSNSFYEDNSNK